MECKKQNENSENEFAELTEIKRMIFLKFKKTAILIFEAFILTPSRQER